MSYTDEIIKLYKDKKPVKVFGFGGLMYNTLKHATLNVKDNLSPRLMDLAMKSKEIIERMDWKHVEQEQNSLTGLA